MSFTRKLETPGFIPSSRVATNNDATRLKLEAQTGLVNLATGLLADYKAKKDRDTANAAITEYEESQFAASAGLSPSEQAVQANPEDDLSPEEQDGLNEALGAASRLDAMVDQAGGADLADIRRVAEYRRLSEKYPSMRSQFRELFKQDYGVTPLGLVDELQTSAQEQEQKRLNAERESILKLAQDNHIPTAGKSVGQLYLETLPLQQELANLDSLRRQAETLRLNTEIGAAHKKAATENFMKRSSGTMLVAANMEVNSILSQMTESPESRAEAKQALQQQRAVWLAGTQETLPDPNHPNVESWLSPQLAIFDQAIAVAEGKEDLELWKNESERLVTMSKWGILSQPGVADAVASSQLVGDMTKNGMFHAADLVSISTEFSVPALRTILSATTPGGIHNPQRLVDNRTPAEQSQVVQSVGTMLKYAEKPEDIAAVVEQMSNLFETERPDVPVSTQHAFLEMVAKPEFLDAMQNQPTISRNFENVAKGWGNRARANLAEDLNKDLSSTDVEIPGTTGGLVGTVRSVLDTLNRAAGGNPSADVNRAPKAMDVVEASVNADGSLTFTPRQEFTNHPEARAVASALTRKWSKRMSTAARGYAHAVQGDKSYRDAADKLLQFPEFNVPQSAAPNPDAQVAAPAVEPAQPEPEEPVTSIDETTRITPGVHLIKGKLIRVYADGSVEQLEAELD